MTSLRTKQIASLHQMLNLNSGVSSNSFGSETVFSVLIYDRHGQDIISPLLSVKELREIGVTLHMLLHSERGEIPDVPAIYFCQPTEENLVRIGQDFSEGLYSSYYLNFTSPISRQKMEDLAHAALQANCHTSIKKHKLFAKYRMILPAGHQTCSVPKFGSDWKNLNVDSSAVVMEVSGLLCKVYDQYVNFISLEEDMFTLIHQGSESLSYHALNRVDAKDTEIEAIIDSIVDSLFSVFVNLGQVPIIRSQRGNAAQMVAERLDKKMRENLRDTRNSFFTGLGSDSFTTGQLSFHRPLLILVDRNLDLSTPLHHTWTYQALSHDLLGLSLNRITLIEPDDNKTGKKNKQKEFELSNQDSFWFSHKGSPFPMVAAAVETELEEYKAAEKKIKGLKADIPIEQPDDLFADNTAKLTSAITSLPELLKRKSNIDKHMSIAMALLNKIKDRKLDVYFEMEEKIMAKNTLEKSLLEFLKDNEAGNADDKLRLFIIFYLCSSDMSETDLSEFTNALTEAGVDLLAFNYIKRWKSLMKMTSGAAPSEYTGGVAKTVSMFSKLMNHGSALVVEGVKNFVLKENKLPITRIVDHLMELKNCEEEKDFIYLDPKIIRPTDASLMNARSKTPFQDAVVFVVGGGNYTEYTNLSNYGHSKSSVSLKRIIYGCTDVVNADQFIAQLSKLGGAVA